RVTTMRSHRLAQHYPDRSRRNSFYHDLLPRVRSVFFFQAEDGIRDGHVTGVQTCALPICYERPGPVPVDRNRGLRIRDLQVARNVEQVRELAQLGGEPRRVVVQRDPVRALQRELIQALGATPADLDRRGVLEEHLDTGDAGQLAIEVADQLVHAHGPL